MSGEKTEKPTAQRKKEARREGRVPRTPDLGSWGGLLAATTVLPMLVRNTMTTSQHLLLQAIGIISDPDPDKALMLFSKSMREAALAVAPLAVGILAVGVAAAASQGGIHVATKLFKPDFKRLNPLSGLKRSFGPHALWEVVKATTKTAVLGAVVYYSLRGLVPKLMTTSCPRCRCRRRSTPSPAPSSACCGRPPRPGSRWRSPTTRWPAAASASRSG